MEQPRAERAPTLEMRSISKTFPGVKALDSVQLKAWAGEVLALMGENGAGKSTLMKILSGAYTADPGGAILIDGQPVKMHRVGERYINVNAMDDFKAAFALLEQHADSF